MGALLTGSVVSLGLVFVTAPASVTTDLVSASRDSAGDIVTAAIFEDFSGWASDAFSGAMGAGRGMGGI